MSQYFDYIVGYTYVKDSIGLFKDLKDIVESKGRIRANNIDDLLSEIKYIFRKRQIKYIKAKPKTGKHFKKYKI